MKQFVQRACRKTARRRAPWAAVITKVEGGFMAFECGADYDMWRKQR